MNSGERVCPSNEGTVETGRVGDSGVGAAKGREEMAKAKGEGRNKERLTSHLLMKNDRPQ